MIKIIGGTFRSRIIETPKTDTTKPTKNSCREGIFNAINMDIRNSHVLDLFAGSGAYGIECISRGADYVHFNDANDNPVKIINKNLSTLKIDNCDVTKSDYDICLTRIKEEERKFDIVFIDPPYAMDCYYKIVNYLIENEIINNFGLIVLETNGNLDLSYLINVRIKEYKYGYSKVYIIRVKK